MTRMHLSGSFPDSQFSVIAFLWPFFFFFSYLPPFFPSPYPRVALAPWSRVADNRIDSSCRKKELGSQTHRSQQGQF